MPALFFCLWLSAFRFMIFTIKTCKLLIIYAIKSNKRYNAILSLTNKAINIVVVMFMKSKR
jgi:uncharacterized membrane protein